MDLPAHLRIWSNMIGVDASANQNDCCCSVNFSQSFVRQVNRLRVFRQQNERGNKYC